MTKYWDRLKTASPRAQIGAALGAALVLTLVLGLLYVLFLYRPYTPLYRDLRPADAAAIVAELDKADIPYRLADDGATIETRRDQAADARLKLASGDMAARGLVGFEVFNKSDMGLTEFAQRVNYQRALQGELVRTINALEGVDAARLHLSISEPSVFRAERVAPKASVTLAAKPGMQISPDLVRGVQNLIAAAVPDLEPARVIVLSGNGTVLSTPVAAPLAEGVARKGAIELYYAALARDAAKRFAANADVQVRAELTPSATTNLSEWSPDKRDFALTLILMTPPGMEDENLVRMREAALSAIGATAQDSAQLEPSGPMPAAPPALVIGGAPALEKPATTAPQAARRESRPELAALIAAAAMLPAFLLLLLFARKSGPKPLSRKRQERLALEVKALLAKGEAGAALET